MQVQVSEIVRQVRSAIDELMQNDSDFLTVSADEANLAQVIIDKIGYALQHVIENAPLEKLDSSAFETLTQAELAEFSIDSTTLVGRLKLPSDLLRIIDARLSSWPYFPIPLPDTSQVALMQQDVYARGSWDRPVNILSYDGASRYLDMYCAKVAADTLKFTLIRKPTVQSYTATDTVTVPDLLKAALIYQTAGLTMLAFREDVAASLFAVADRYMNTEQMKREDRQ